MGSIGAEEWPFMVAYFHGPVGDIVAPGPLHRLVRQGAYGENILVGVVLNFLLVKVDFALFHQVPGGTPQGVRSETRWPSEPVSL